MVTGRVLHSMTLPLRVLSNEYLVAVVVIKGGVVIATGVLIRLHACTANGLKAFASMHRYAYMHMYMYMYMYIFVNG